MRTVSSARLGVPACVLVAALAIIGPPAWSCALEGGLLSSSLSLQHPRTTEVAFAMHDAIERGELRHDPAPPSAFALLRARSRLQQLRAALAKSNLAAEEPRGFAIVLIDYGLWSRVRADGAGVALQLHIDGPAKDEIVVVTGEAVLEAMLDGRLSARQAIEQRLLVVADDLGSAVGVRLGRAFPARD